MLLVQNTRGNPESVNAVYPRSRVWLIPCRSELAQNKVEGGGTQRVALLEVFGLRENVVNQRNSSFLVSTNSAICEGWGATLHPSFRSKGLVLVGITHGTDV